VFSSDGEKAKNDDEVAELVATSVLQPQQKCICPLRVTFSWWGRAYLVRSLEKGSRIKRMHRHSSGYDSLLYRGRIHNWDIILRFMWDDTKKLVFEC